MSRMIGDHRAMQSIVFIAVLMIVGCAPSVEVTVKPGMDRAPQRPHSTVAGAKPELRTGPVEADGEGPPPNVERVPLPKRQQTSTCPPAMAPSCR